MPRSRAQTAHLSENAPETTASTRSGARFRSAASQSPVAAAVAVKQKPRVRKTFWRRDGMSR